MQVFKFVCYVSIPVGMTYLIAGKPHVLEAIIKNVSYSLLEHYMLCIPCCMPPTARQSAEVLRGVPSRREKAALC